MSSRTTRHRHVTFVTLACAAVLGASITAASGAVDAGGLSVTRTDQPGADAPEYVLPLAPGGSAVRSVSVTNTTSFNVTVLVYGADAAPTDDGLSVADGTDNSSVGAWLTTEDDTLELAAGDSIDVEFRVTRPEGDEDGGMGAVVVQLSDDSREELAQPTLQRAAIPVLVAADGTGESVTIGRTSIEGDEAVVTVTNSTPEAVTLTGEVVHDGVGEETVLATVGPATVPAGESAELRAPLEEGAGLAGALRPFLRVTDAGGLLEGPAGDAPRGLLVSGFLLLAAAAVATSFVARRQRRVPAQA